MTDPAEDNGEGMLAPGLEVVCEDLVAQKVRLARVRARIKESEAVIKKAMGVNRFLEAGKYTVTWQTTQRKGYEVAAGTSRKFTIKERKDGD